MTPEERNDYKWKWHRYQVRYERIYTTKFKAALQAQIREWALNQHITSTGIYEVLLDLYKTVGSLWAARTGIHRMKKMERKERMPMGFNERIVELMRNLYAVDLLNDAEEITANSRDAIAKILGDAAQSGASLNEVVALMLKSNDFGTIRARKIARTETVRSSNAASLINAKESGLPLNKVWFAINDKRTRHSHKAIDDRKIGIDEFFEMEGGVTMLAPGARTQKNGTEVPGSYTINCRCVLAYEKIK